MRLNFLICLMLLSCLFSISCASVDQPSAVEVERVQIGNYHSRALFGAALDQKKLSKKPLVILIPGSGPNGPESFMPPELTLDHQNHPLLTEFAWPLRQAGFHTLQLGKPGVDYGYDENNANKFYDLAMVKSVTWNDLILNLKVSSEFTQKFYYYHSFIAKIHKKPFTIKTNYKQKPMMS